MSKRQGVMLCYPWDEKRLAKWPKPWIVQPKYKGIRCKTYVLGQGSVRMVSSEGNVIESVPDIKKAIENAHLSPGTILDGELYIHGVPQGVINSIVLRSKALHPEHISVTYEVFDCPSLIGTQQMRIPRVLNEVERINNRNIIPVPSHYVRTVEEVKDLLLRFKSQRYEGIVAKSINCFYEEKRSIHWMKWKPGEVDTYAIIGSREEISIHGEPKNTLGSLICITKGEEEFSVGSGLTRQQRQLLWERRDLLYGMVVTVGYAELTARGVPEHPVIISIN